jgi:predicted  nucleic acid-binding Zn-ribbon protein
MIFEILPFIGGAVFTIVAVIVKDAVMKNTLQHEIRVLRTNYESQEHINKAQEARITNNREELLALKGTMLNLRERFDDLYNLQKEEVKSIQHTLNETNQRFASLDATLKGLTKWLERVEHKLEER